MKGDEVIEDADLLVVDNRIAALGAHGTLDIPPEAARIDVAGMTIVPGFVDLHPHMSLRLGVLDTEAWPLMNYLAYGVTTARDPQTGTVDAFVYEDLVETGDIRSEEHTSELQSLMRISYAVFCLKKKHKK